MSKDKSSSADGIKWDLEDLYEGPDDEQLNNDFENFIDRAEEFRNEYRGKIEECELSKSEFKEAMDKNPSIIFIEVAIMPKPIPILIPRIAATVGTDIIHWVNSPKIISGPKATLPSITIPPAKRSRVDNQLLALKALKAADVI